jgi:hypothetical protein
MAQTTKSISAAQSMHKFVWICLGALSLIVVTVPSAIVRVSQMEKFKGSHVKSMTDEWKLPKSSSSGQTLSVQK